MPAPICTKTGTYLGGLAALDLEDCDVDRATADIEALVLDNGPRSGFLHGLLCRAELLAPVEIREGAEDERAYGCT